VAIPDAAAIPWTEDAVRAATGTSDTPAPPAKRLLIPLVIAVAIIAALIAFLLWSRGSHEPTTPEPNGNSPPAVDPNRSAAPKPAESQEKSTADSSAADPSAADSSAADSSKAPPVDAADKPSTPVRKPELPDGSEPTEKPAVPETSNSPEKTSPVSGNEAPIPARSTDAGTTARKSQESITASKKDEVSTGINRVLPGPPGLKPTEPSLTNNSGPEPVAGRFAKLVGGAAISSVDTTPSPLASPVAPAREKSAPAINPPSPVSAAAPNKSSTSGEGAAAEMQRPAAREIDLKARLTDRVAGLSIERVPLCDFLQLISDLTTIPISIDLDALALRGISPLNPLPVQLEKTTIEQGLDAILKSQQLGYRQLDGQLVIMPREQTMPRRESRTYDVSDLVGKEPELATTLLRWIRSSVDPSGWQPDVNPDELRLDSGQLIVEHTTDNQLQVMRLCDQWRVARKIRPKFPLPAPLVDVGINLEQWQTLLDKPLTLTFPQPVRFSVLLERLGKSAGTKFLVDWQALAEADWSPDMTATLGVENRPLSEVLDKLLGPRELTYRILDASLIEVTTPGAIARRVEFRLHAIPGLTTATNDSAPVKDSLQRVRTVLKLEDAAEATGGVPSVEWDVLSRHLVVIASPTQQFDVARALRSESTTVAP
jgi:hypothetical protein